MSMKGKQSWRKRGHFGDLAFAKYVPHDVKKYKIETYDGKKVKIIEGDYQKAIKEAKFEASYTGKPMRIWKDMGITRW